MVTSSIEYEGLDLGVGDFVLLSEISMNAFVENLKTRFEKGRIYTYIGEVLVSVNPYRELPLYRPEYIKIYQGCEIFERPAHIFALADAAYRKLKKSSSNSCFIISGESGSGKTEAFKIILRYITSITNPLNQRINNIIMETNIILETFGNSRTNRNDNSSRFGKYIDLYFDYKYDLIGGKIQYYLLEKSRVIKQQLGERNFHVFYQLLTDEEIISKYGLNLLSEEYYYINQGNNCKNENINDRLNYEQIIKALNIIGFNKDEISTIWKIIAVILHLGNLKFINIDDEHCVITESNEKLEWISKLLECEQSEISSALTSRTITERNENFQIKQNITRACYTRDILSKALYERLFEWLIEYINKILSHADYDEKIQYSRMIGLIDIYGFENFENNTFEQLCINYCDEKIHQLFIELIFKQEQEEYENENIPWQHIDYFNNKIICDLIEQPRCGLLARLDEACLVVGTITDEIFLNTINKEFKTHEYYSSWNLTPKDKIWKENDMNKSFLIRHYAGDVVYSVNGFLDKNRDILFDDFKRLLYNSKNPVISAMWPEEEKTSTSQTRRSLTAGSLFRNSMINLSNLLLSKQPSFIRCIKPNNEKAHNIFDQALIKHQISYLNLLENVYIRRFGFCYRSSYEQFVRRYKVINCVRSNLYPNGPFTEDNAAYICNQLQIENDVAYGNTKLFIKQPISLFELEKQRMEGLQTIIIILQNHIRSWKQCRIFHREISAAKIQNFYRKYRSQTYVHSLCQSFSMSLGKNMTWPKSRSSSAHIDKLLNQIYRQWRIKQIKQDLPIEQQSKFELKLVSGKYLQQRASFFDISIFQEWKGDYLLMSEENLRFNEYQKFINDLRKKDDFNQVLFSTFAVKLNSRLKIDERAIILTDKYIYKSDPKRNFQMKKTGIYIDDIIGLSLTPGKEQLIVIHLISNHDLVFYMDTKTDRVGELVGYMIKLKQKSSEFFINVQRNVSINIAKYKYIVDIVWNHIGKIEFRKGSNNNISLMLPDSQ